MTASYSPDEARRSADVVIVPDRHGTGTNALVLSPPDAIVPAFGEGSKARHVEAARVELLARDPDRSPVLHRLVVGDQGRVTGRRVAAARAVGAALAGVLIAALPVGMLSNRFGYVGTAAPVKVLYIL